jgi:hypothetical protein
MLRKILIALAAVFLLVVGVGAYFVHRISSQLEQDSRNSLQKLVPHVVTGEGLLVKCVFYKAYGARQIWQLSTAFPTDREGAVLTVVSDDGAHFLDGSGQEMKAIRFSESVFCPIEVVRINASGDYGFLTHDQRWAVGVTFFDKLGHKRWNYPSGLSQGVDDAAPLDEDGKFGVVVGFNGSGGIALVDGDGKKIWEKPDTNVWHVETLDIHGDGHQQILHTNARGQFVVRTPAGEVTANYQPGVYVSEFALTRWGNEPQAKHILAPSKVPSEGCCKPAFLVLDASEILGESCSGMATLSVNNESNS